MIGSLQPCKDFLTSNVIPDNLQSLIGVWRIYFSINGGQITFSITLSLTPTPFKVEICKHERALNKALIWTPIIIKLVWECVITLNLELFLKPHDMV